MMRRELLTAKWELDQIKKILFAGSRERSFVSPYGFDDYFPKTEIDHVYWKAYEHCATIVRAYATFENFVLTTVEHWIAWSFANKPDLILKSVKARNAYEAGFADILKRKTEARFADVDLRKLATGLTTLYAEKMPLGYVLPTEPFFSTLPNLRLKTIHNLYASVEIGNLEAWVASNKKLRDFCNDEGFGVEEELTQLVHRRNEAAHGNKIPAEILGTNDLISRIDLLSLLCEVIYECTVASVCQAQLGLGYGMGLIGTVTALWPRHSSFELSMNTTVITTATPVIFICSGSLMPDVINSLMLEGDPGIGFEVKIGTAMGVRTGQMPTIGMQMISQNSVVGLRELISKSI